jgi:outer membrane protein
VPRFRLLQLATLALVLQLAVGCSHLLEPELPGPLPESPAQRASLPAPPPPQASPPVQLPENWQELANRLTLADVVDIALANSPVTRASWLEARAAAASLGSTRSELYPTLDLDAEATRSEVTAFGGQFSYLNTSYGPSLALSYLLFDFGGRGARVDEALATLHAADWEHDAVIQDVVLEVEQAYYRYLESRARLKAAEVTVEDAKLNLEAAKRRQEVGVATVADVLQAQTALSRAELERVRASGAIEALRGSLAAAMGLPANTEIDVGELPGDIVLPELTATAQELIEQAVSGRPELVAARLRSEASERHTDATKASRWPELMVSGSASRTYYEPSPYAEYGDGWSAALLLRMPLFTGFRLGFDIEEALARAEQARVETTRLEQLVVLEVWTAFVDLKTAAERVKSARDLLESADQSEKVALARYREGVGSILDSLAAQAAMANARSERISAYADWFVAAARLARATGSLGPQHPAPTVSGLPVENLP